MKSIKSTIRLIYLIQFVLLNSSCTNDRPDFENKTLTYQNIVILSDLSSRLQNNNCRDTAIIGEIIKKFKQECVKPGEKIGDRSSLIFGMLNTPILASVDIGKIKILEEKQQFVNSTGKYKNKGLDYELDKFYETVKNTYKTKSNPGLDLIGLLIDKIENDNIVKQNTFVTDGIDTTFFKYDNHIYIFTDGYLETDSKPTTISGSFYFSDTEIGKIRKYAQHNNLKPDEALDKIDSFRLTKAPRKKNALVKIHLLETDDRDYDVVKGKWKYSHGLNDNDILKAVWKQWAKDSNFKGELHWVPLTVSISSVLK